MAEGKKKNKQTGKAVDTANRLHSAAIHLLRRLRVRDDVPETFAAEPVGRDFCGRATSPPSATAPKTTPSAIVPINRPGPFLSGIAITKSAGGGMATPTSGCTEDVGVRNASRSRFKR